MFNNSLPFTCANRPAAPRDKYPPLLLLIIKAVLNGGFINKFPTFYGKLYIFQKPVSMESVPPKDLHTLFHKEDVVLA